MMFVHLARLGRRFILMLGGEVLQSAFHFGFNIALMQLLPPREYGIFAIVMLIGGLALTYMRALVGVPASLTIPVRRASRAAALDVSFGSAALALAALVAAGVVIGLHVASVSGAAAAGLFVGLWALRSYIRIALFARRSSAFAAISDVVFAGSGAVFATLLLRSGSEELLGRVFVVLCLANALAIMTALHLPRQPVRISLGRATRRRFRLLWPQLAWSCIGVTTANLQAQGQVLLIALVAGPAAYAPIAAMVVFFAPLRLASAAIANMMQPELAGHAARGEWTSVRHLLAAWTMALFLIAAVTGVGIALAFPWINGAVFAGQPKFLIGLLAWMIAATAALYVMPRILLEVFREFRLIAVMTAFSAVTGMTIAAVTLRVATTAWSLTGAVAAEVIVAVWCWVAVLRLPRAISIPGAPDASSLAAAGKPTLSPPNSRPPSLSGARP